MAEHRLARFVFDFEVLEDLLRGRWAGTSTDLPPDAEVLWATGSEDRRQLTVVMRSRDFDPVPTGHQIPTRMITVRRDA